MNFQCTGREAAMPYSHLATTTNILWKILAGYGHDPDPLFREVGIDPAALKKPGVRIRYALVEQLWRKAVALIDDPCFGLQAPRYWHPSYLHALGYAWLASHSLREALGRFIRYLRIISEAGSVLLDERPGRLRLTIDNPSSGMRVSAQVDTFMAYIVHMCRLNFGEELAPLRVAFMHPEPPCVEKHHAHFRSPVVFSAAADSIDFAAADIDRYLTGSNPEIARLNDQVLTTYLAKLEKTDIIPRVKAGIIDQLQSGDVTDEKVAKAIGMSARSLQRQLNRSNTTFRTLLDEIRKDLALNYLRDPSIELSEIAFLLGFSEQSAFSRSFKRLTGRSPTDVRA
jgi:AraC-like DNA-binding protein